MLIGSRQKLSTLSSPPDRELSIENVPLEEVTSVKSLGIFIDENLQWQIKRSSINKKIASGIGAIKKIRYFVSTPSLNCIYNALIQGHPMDLFLKISVLHANFCWLGDVKEIIVLGRKVLLGKR